MIRLKITVTVPSITIKINEKNAIKYLLFEHIINIELGEFKLI